MRKRPSCGIVWVSDRPIVIAGAGAIGCFVGGLLAAASKQVAFLGRARVAADIAEHGLHLTDFGGLDRRLASVQITEAPDILSEARCVLVCVKTADTQGMAEHIAEHARADAMVISLQNGLDASRILREALPERDVRAGMVPFNVVARGPGQYHRATSGDIVIQAGPNALDLSVPDLRVLESDRIEAVQWGKLIINLNNAVNALSGLTLQSQLLDRRWRRVMAAQMAEALGVLKANGISSVSTTPVPLGLVPFILRLPTPVFRRIAAQMLTIDPLARTSMAYDLAAGKRTEIDALQGQIVELAESAPICAHVAGLIRQMEQDGAARKCEPSELTPKQGL